MTAGRYTSVSELQCKMTHGTGVTRSCQQHCWLLGGQSSLQDGYGYSNHEASIVLVSSLISGVDNTEDAIAFVSVLISGVSRGIIKWFSMGDITLNIYNRCKRRSCCSVRASMFIPTKPGATGRHVEIPPIDVSDDIYCVEAM